MKWTHLPTAVIACLLTSLPVLAQNATKAPVPKSTLAKPWACVVAAFFLILLVALPSFLGSKRGHLD